MSTTTVPASRWTPADGAFATATTRGDSVPDIGDHDNVGYTQTIGLLTSDRKRVPLKYLYFTKVAVPGARRDVPYFEIEEEQAGHLGATVATLVDWPLMWRHPERVRTLDAIARLATHVDELERDAWAAVLEAIELSLQLHAPANIRFKKLAKEWREETSFCSDPNEIFLHAAYQQIIGMGTLALPFIFASLEKEIEHWFWALRAITGEDPVPENDRGDLDKMAHAWLDWARARRRKLTLGWLYALAASELIDER
jgi:hypothetical protein